MVKKICKRCGCIIEGYPALSRLDNTSEICSDCGQIEALEAMYIGHVIDWREPDEGRCVGNQDV